MLDPARQSVYLSNRKIRGQEGYYENRPRFGVALDAATACRFWNRPGTVERGERRRGDTTFYGQCAVPSPGNGFVAVARELYTALG